MLMRYWKAFTDRIRQKSYEGCSKGCSRVKVSASMSINNKLPVSAEKRNSTNFACRAFCEVRGVRQTSLDGTLCARSIRQRRKEADEHMSVARVTELSAISDKSFEDAINQAVSRATKTLRGVEGCWVKDMNVMIEDGNITGYKVNVEITFVLEE
jgi:flavin-binding protein dodecin